MKPHEAPPSAQAREYVPPVETHLIASKHVNQVFRIQVMRPALRRGQDERFPVVYATDANLTFDALKGISYSMQLSPQVAPRFILVGIGYPSDCPWAGALLRGRDLMFPGYPKLALKPLAIEGVLMAEPGTRDLYGAEDFQRFIEEELIPLVDERYPTIEGDRAYFGHSAGGGFGFFTLFNKPRLFDRYILSSTGMSFRGESSGGVRYEQHDFMLEMARQFIASGRSVEGKTLYMSAGTGEEFEPGGSVWQFMSGFYRMAALLKAAAMPGLSLIAEALPGERHMTVWPIAFMRGIQAVFGTRSGNGDAST